MYYASGILGLRGELRPAPLKNTVAVGIDASHHYQYFFEEPLAGQLPKFDASSSGSINNGTTVTIAHTVANQPNRVMLIWVFGSLAFNDVFEVTYAGEPTYIFASELVIPNLSARLFYMIEPATGTNNIVFTSTPTAADYVVIAASFYDTNQTNPLHAGWSTTGTGTSIAQTGIDSSTNEIMVAGSGTAANTTDTKDAAETLIATVLNAGSDFRGTASYKTGAASGSMTHTLGASNQWVFVGGSLVGTAGAAPSYLYLMRGGKAGNTPCYLEKVDLFNSAFGTLETGNYTLTNLKKAGQPTRYQGFWWLPDGDEFDPRKLTVAGGAPSGELAASTAWAAGGADHLGNMNGQMIAGLKDNGYAILSINGTPTTTANWGSYYTVGDRDERPAAISGLSGLSFVLTVEGLLSFNDSGRSGLIFEDFRSWRNVFDNIPMPPWRGGLLIPHPTGLLYYTPGEAPVNVGVEVKGAVGGLPPTGATELHGGRYMGVYATGDYVWAIYQPLLSSTAALVLCGYSQTGEPHDLTWQSVSTTTLQDAQHLLGIFVSAQSQPNSSTYSTPCVWYGDNDDLAYNILDQRAGPFRSRADTHKVVTSGDAFMGEMFFPVAVDLDDIIIETQDMASGDEWQISVIVNNSGTDINVGAPIVASGRHRRSLQSFEGTYRIMVHVSWLATSVASRVPPTIKRIELYGNPTNA